MVFKCEKVEKIYFTVEAESEEQAQEFIYTHSINEIVGLGDMEYIESDDSERIICQVEGDADIDIRDEQQTEKGLNSIIDIFDNKHIKYKQEYDFIRLYGNFDGYYIVRYNPEDKINWIVLNGVCRDQRYFEDFIYTYCK